MAVLETRKTPATTPMTPNTEAAVERQLAEKKMLLQQLREQAEALEVQINDEQFRLSTAQSERRNRKMLNSAGSVSQASTARPMTAATRVRGCM
jgi:hypothetical protein